MEAVNPAAAKAAKRAQNPQDPRVEKTRRPEAASNALLDATSREALEERPTSPEIIVIPQTEQMGPTDDVNTVEILADEVSPRIFHSGSSFEGAFLLSLMRKVTLTLTPS